MLTTADSSRVIVATALNAARTGFWSGSNDFEGIGGVAAPGESIRMLTHGGSTTIRDGTSFSAPLVAAAASLLLTFDPAISGAEVKRLLVTDTLVNSTGSLVSGVDGRHHVGAGTNLDAYSPLAMRARTVGGLPVCGYPVRILDTTLTSIRLDAAGPAARTITVPGAAGLSSLSVAQGGRRIALYDFNLDRTIVINHLGQVIQTTAPGIMRSYLERDTVDATFSSSVNHNVYTFRGDSTHLNVDFFANVLSPTRAIGALEIAPDAARAPVDRGRGNGHGLL